MGTAQKRAQPKNKSRPEGRLLLEEALITSSRPVQQRAQQQEPTHQQQVQRREPTHQQQVRERAQRQVPVREPVQALSCHRQTEQQRRRWLPERETCSLLVP